jgi:hypothetical protein
LRYILTLLVFLISDVSLLWYLVNLEYFSPFTFQGEIDSWNIIFFTLMFSLALGFFIALVEYLAEYFMFYGRKEWPRSFRSIKILLSVFAASFIFLSLHIFHFLDIRIGLVLAILSIIGIILIR